MSEDRAWKQFDDDVDMVLETTMQGNVERKINTLSTIAYNIGKERFGVEEQRQSKGSPWQQTNENRREREIKNLRKELKSIKNQFKIATEVERIGLQQIRDDIRDKLKRTRNAERIRRNRKERSKKRSQFIKDPYKFTKTLLGEERSGRLTSTQEEIEHHLNSTHQDEQRQVPLGECHRVRSEPPPKVPFDQKEPTWKEVQDIVKKARTGSAPGPSGISYKVYKKCPKLLRRLWLLIRKIWSKGVIPDNWKMAEGCFVPKEKDSKTIDQFRTISLLSVECNIFFSILARRLTSYMTNNKYVDTSSQKGAIPGFSGYVEHTSIVSQLIRETKANKGDLTVVWLDLANAYGTIPHKLIETALDHYYIPEHIKGMVKNYLNGMRLRFSAGNITTSYISLEKGIVTGCTVSPILFIMGMNIIMKAAERETRGPRMNSGIYQPANRGFMDDLTVTTQTHVQARWVLSALEDVVSWARMKFKPRKSRYMIIKKGQISHNSNLKFREKSYHP